SGSSSMPGSRSGLTSVRPGLGGRGVPGNSFSVLSGFCAYTPSRLFMPAPHLLNTLGFGVRLTAFNVWGLHISAHRHSNEQTHFISPFNSDESYPHRALE